MINPFADTRSPYIAFPYGKICRFRDTIREFAAEHGAQHAEQKALRLINRQHSVSVGNKTIPPDGTQYIYHSELKGIAVTACRIIAHEEIEHQEI